jgi:hypothetical protein
VTAAVNSGDGSVTVTSTVGLGCTTTTINASFTG